MQSLAAALLIAFALPAAASGDSQPPEATRRVPFTHLGAAPVLELRGHASTATVEFGSRADELVTRAAIRFRYAWSPALAPTRSHIRVTLNNEVVGVLPVVPGEAGSTVSRAIEVDPRLIVGFNRLVLTLVAQREAGTGDDARPGLWADVSGASELETAVRPLAVADDLALLPEPFFDRRDQRRVSIPFVFGAQPSTATLRAASVVASWFGQLARWRGARFPASLDAPAPGHAVAFAPNGERPSFLAALPQASGPELRLVTNPADGYSRLLLVLGRDGDDLKAAADALVLGGAALSGAKLAVKPVPPPAPRAAYDVPGWVRVDRAMKLGELIDWPQQLEATGAPPALPPIRVNLRVPPDLAVWRSAGVPMTLRFRYSPPACAGPARLEVGINDELLGTIALRTSGVDGGTPASPAPLPAAIADSSEILIPAFRLRSRSQLQFAFRFDTREDGACQGVRAAAVRAAVDADSSIDFSGFPHYAEMPNLGHFVTAGFPFTRHADLSRTVAVVPDRPVAAEVSTLLALMGRMGESTAHPATAVRVAGPSDEAALADADLILIGAARRQPLLEKWADRLPAAITPDARRVSAPERRAAAPLDWLGLGAAPDAPPSGPVRVEGAGPVAAMLGFESPVTSGRSVVAVTATAPELVERVVDALEDPDMRRAMRGSVVFVLPSRVESVHAGRHYAIGFMPPWAGFAHQFAERPALYSAATAVALLVLAYLVWGVRRFLGARRSRARA